MVYCSSEYTKTLNFLLLAIKIEYFSFFRYVKVSRSKITSKKNFSHFNIVLNSFLLLTLNKLFQIKTRKETASKHLLKTDSFKKQP